MMSWLIHGCISFDSYIKPQLRSSYPHYLLVVYLLIPTSNHNSSTNNADDDQVVYLLIPTSNHNPSSLQKKWSKLYIFWFLHQTTTLWEFGICDSSCISFDSYIKPQPLSHLQPLRGVVYLLIPTSNHNYHDLKQYPSVLYIFWFLHQTTTNQLHGYRQGRCISFDSYIKPQRIYSAVTTDIGCISFDSYIKPQRQMDNVFCQTVVYLLIPTSNHNESVVNLNLGSVVYLLIPTSNHNLSVDFDAVSRLYIFWFLHQTTTIGV